MTISVYNECACVCVCVCVCVCDWVCVSCTQLCLNMYLCINYASDVCQIDY